MNITDLYDLLTKEYYLKLVQNDDDIAQLKEVRKKVLLPAYDKRTHIEDVDEFIYNQDDEQSFNYILVHRKTNKAVGTIRIFFINDKTPIQQLPMQMYGGVDDIEDYTKDKPICEISRLALIKDLPSYKDIPALSLRTSLTMGLFIALGINIILYSYKKIYTINEPSLSRMVRRQGVEFQVIGKEVNYFGRRIPYIINYETLIKNSNKTIEELTLYYLKEIISNPTELIQYIDKHPYLELDELNLNKLKAFFQQNPNPSAVDLLKWI
jgi:N-acyl-L-homoserine lactone synthetase